MWHAFVLFMSKKLIILYCVDIINDPFNNVRQLCVLLTPVLLKQLQMIMTERATCHKYINNKNKYIRCYVHVIFQRLVLIQELYE